MTSLIADGLDNRGCSRIQRTREPSALDLLVALNAIILLGPQMFERDCLACTFDSWRQLLARADLAPNEHFSATDVLSDIADIRTIPQRHPDIAEVDPELLDAASAIEQFVKARMPSLQ